MRRELNMAEALTHRAQLRRARRQSISGKALVVIACVVVSLLLSFLSPSPLHVILSGAALGAIVYLMWWNERPSVLLIAPLFQWSEVSIIPISTVWRQVPLSELVLRRGDLEAATIYGLLGVVALTLGLRLAIRSQSDFDRKLDREAQALSFREVLVFSSSMILVGKVIAALGSFAGPAAEAFNQFSNISLIGNFVLTYWCVRRRKYFFALAIMVAVELGLGMTGFFAEFKYPLLAILSAGIVGQPAMKFKSVFVVGALLAPLLLTATFWSAVKPEYRDFLNQGTGMQAVFVPIDERASYLTGAAASMDASKWQIGFDRLVDRHGYTFFLAETMAYVPAGRPHEGGSLSMGVIRHIAQPRVFFPEKPRLPNDTEVMAKYTGRAMTWDQNTSISLGHLAELYIDFGYVGGLLGMAFIGWLTGTLSKIITKFGSVGLINSALVVMLSLSVAYFGTALIKLIGSLIFGFIVALTFQLLFRREYLFGARRNFAR